MWLLKRIQVILISFEIQNLLRAVLTLLIQKERIYSRIKVKTINPLLAREMFINWYNIVLLVVPDFDVSVIGARCNENLRVKRDPLNIAD